MGYDNSPNTGGKPSPQEQRKKPMTLSETPAERIGTVFIVDDEAMVTTSLKAMLSLETRHHIHCFNSPLAALAAIDGESEDGTPGLRPEVVVSDFSMPEMDGIEFLCAVKQRLPETTLILLTGYADKGNAIKAINTAGIYRYIEKPWDNEELKLSIKNGIERAHLVSDLKMTVSELTEARAQLQETNRDLEKLVEERTQDLRVTYQKLQSIISSTADGIITLTPDLELSSLNPAAEKWLAAALDRPDNPWLLSGLPLEQFLHIPDEPDIRAVFAQLGHNSAEEASTKLVREAGIGNLPVEVSIARIPDEGGFVLVVRDITQRKEIERLREDFVSTLTHDLRTPLLSSIQTLTFFLDGTIRESPLGAKQTELIGMLINSNKEMLGLVNVLLEVYKYEAGRQKLVFDRVDLGALISTVCRELDALAQSRRQTLSIAVPEGATLVWGDKQELRRVIVNLVGNAINYTQTDGSIQVRLESNGKSVTACVEDNGRGIPAQDLPTLFQRFSQGTSRKRSSGSGLGLYLSRQIIEAHQGSISVDSQEGQGSCFRVKLPSYANP